MFYCIVLLQRQRRNTFVKMSTQDESGVGFEILPEESQQHFRLLELPPELLALLTSENAPTYALGDSWMNGVNRN